MLAASRECFLVIGHNALENWYCSLPVASRYKPLPSFHIPYSPFCCCVRLESLRSQSHSAATQHIGKSALLIGSQYMMPTAPQRSHPLSISPFVVVDWWSCSPTATESRSQSQSFTRRSLLRYSRRRHNVLRIGKCWDISRSMFTKKSLLEMLGYFQKYIYKGVAVGGRWGMSGRPTRLFNNLG